MAGEIGPYALEAVLGQGGAGVVYRARDVRDGTPVALKTVAAARPWALDGLRREIRALARVRHPGIVRIVDHGVHEGVPWLATELVDGPSLHSWTTTSGEAARTWGDEDDDVPQATPLAARPIREVLDLVCALCEPLAWLHGEGLVHRDLKPDNVRLRPDGQPVLVDFGLAAVSAGPEAREAVVPDVRGGTRGYVAPEQLAGRDVDARADLYALGAMAYELLTGVLPTGVIGPPSELRDGLPPGLDDLVLALLAPRPEDRPGHADDVARALVAMGATPPEPGPPPRPYVYRPRLVGRSEALQRLDSALACGTGFVVVHGESGVGKSRLVRAFLQDLPSSAAVFATACEPGQVVPLDGLRRALDPIADRARAAGEDADPAVLAAAPVLAELVPSFRALGGEAPQRIPAAEARQRALEAIVAVVRASVPAVLAIDDLQWIDPFSADALVAILDGGVIDLLVVATCRAGEEGAAASLLARPRTTVLPLRRLDPDDVEAVVADMLGVSEPPPGLAARLAELSEGNPFYVAEYLRTAVDEGLLAREGGRWRLTTAPRDLPLPGAMRDLVARRLAGLSPAARACAEAAAVLGREARLDHLEAMGVGAGVDELVARLVLEGDGPTLRFTHGKLREGIVALLGDATSLHRAAADAIEACPDAEAHLAALAAHREAAGQIEAARERWLQAGDLARRRYVPEEIEACLSRFVALAGPAHPAWADAVRDLSQALVNQHRVPEAIALLERSLDVAGGAAFPIADALFNLLAVSGALEAAERVCERMEALCGPTADALTRGRTSQAQGTLEDYRGRFDRADAHYAAAGRAFAGVGAHARVGGIASLRGNLAAEQGRLEDARGLYDEALAAYRRADEPRGEGIVLGNLAMLLHEQGAVEEADRVAREALAIDRRVHNRRSEAIMVGFVGYCRLQAGDPEGAWPLLERQVELFEALRDERMLGVAIGQLAELELVRGNVGAARRLAEDALRRTERHDDPLEQGRILVLRASIAVRAGEDPVVYYDRAVALAEILGAGERSSLGQALERLRAEMEDAGLLAEP